MCKNLKHLSNIFFLLIFVFLIKNANSADVNIAEDTTTQQTLQASSTLTIKSGFALQNATLDRIVKGYNPEIKFRHRKEILMSIKYVDRVIPSNFRITNKFKKIYYVF